MDKKYKWITKNELVERLIDIAVPKEWLGKKADAERLAWKQELLKLKKEELASRVSEIND